eukprot:6071512-Pyramimonas_sp.AAC.1
MRNAMGAPGVLHVLSNMPKDLASVFSHWDEHFQQLKLFEQLLGDNQHRERLRATCFKDDHGLSKQFEKFSGTLYDKRWFSVFFFVARAVPLIESLVTKWDARTYAEGFSHDKQQDDQRKRFNHSDVRAVLDDSMFHSYNRLVLGLGGHFKRLQSWVERCPCHGRAERRQPCMIAGCRAPELAAGALEDFHKDTSRLVNACKGVRESAR